MPPSTPATGGALLLKMAEPAVALLVKNNCASPIVPSLAATTKFCACPELLVMPVPLMVRVRLVLTVIP